MSLVERALKKLQESRALAQPAAPGAPGARPPRVEATAALPVPEPRKPAKTIPIDRAALLAAEILPPPEEERRLAHEYRNIKRPLIANAFGRGVPALNNGRLILVASALPGDGKTFTSINLALSMAMEKDISVLLVDADVAKRHVSKMFNATQEPGLLDTLRDERVDAESLVLATDIPNLSFLPAGRHSETATELLASTRMGVIASQLLAADASRVILFDSPPLLLTSESRALSSVGGQAVLVVRAGVTPQQAVLDAANLVGEGKFIGLVLNQSDAQSRANYYYYGDQDGAAATTP
jgi:protein-tyrosine kinase